MPRSVLILPLLAACSDYSLTEEKDAHDSGCLLEELSGHGVAADPECGFVEEPGGFSPAVEWQWSGAVGSPGYDDVMMMPAVGDVDGDGMPEVVVTSYAGTGYGSAGALTILSGDGAGEEASWTSIGGYTPAGSGGVALGDLEGDGVPEIVVVSSDLRLLALHADGTLVWATEPRSGDFAVYGYPAIADLDGDGRAEVVAGRAIFACDGTLVGAGSHGVGGPYGISVVVDLDGDGQQEVVVSNAAYRRDGSTLWTADVPDGWTAVGDFDGDGQGEVAAVASGGIYLLDTDGTLLWGPTAVPGGGGGPPTVADFDGDGDPEIGVAGYSGYLVVETDGTILWEQPTTDHSSARTGSSVFDFEGDGAWEVVYADELTLWVYDGATGAPLMAEDGHSSWTLFEYPVIVDVDADGDAEIVLASNDSINPGWQGVTVVGDDARSWAPTTLAWNQHAYHITNVEDDLSIPPRPTMNWHVGHNSFRAGGLRERPGIPAPDLAVTLGSACWTCGPPGVEIAFQVVNRGTADVTADVPVTLYAILADGSWVALETVSLPGGVGAGMATDSLVLRADLPAGTVTAIAVDADDDAGPGVIHECDETNNATEQPVPACG